MNSANTRPRVSVLISTFNRSQFLKGAVKSALEQTYQPYEIIVVDDGSTDNTPEICQSFRNSKIKYIRQENYGLGFARERAVKSCSGDLLAWLDDDDRWLPEKLERVVRFFHLNPTAGWVHSDAIEIDQNGKVLNKSYLEQFARKGLKMEGEVYDEMLIDCFPLTSTVVMKRECLKKLKGFFTDQDYGADVDFFLRASIFFKLGKLGEKLVFRTMHPTHSERANNIYDYYVKVKCRIPIYRRILEEKDPLTEEQKKKTKQMLKEYHYRLGEVSLAQGRANEARLHFLLSLCLGLRAIKALLLFLKSFAC